MLALIVKSALTGVHQSAIPSKKVYFSNSMLRLVVVSVIIWVLQTVFLFNRLTQLLYLSDKKNYLSL